MTRRRKDIGDWGESLACDFLRRHAFEVVERNFFTTTGEIDIVAIKGGDYYFFEVKTRLDRHLATDDAVTTEKQRRFRRAVSAYCYRRSVPDTGIIMGSIIVFVDKRVKTVSFRLALWP